MADKEAKLAYARQLLKDKLAKISDGPSKSKGKKGKKQSSTKDISVAEVIQADPTAPTLATSSKDVSMITADGTYQSVAEEQTATHDDNHEYGFVTQAQQLSDQHTTNFVDENRSVDRMEDKNAHSMITQANPDKLRTSPGRFVHENQDIFAELSHPSRALDAMMAPFHEPIEHSTSSLLLEDTHPSVVDDTNLPTQTLSVENDRHDITSPKHTPVIASIIETGPVSLENERNAQSAFGLLSSLSTESQNYTASVAQSQETDSLSQYCRSLEDRCRQLEEDCVDLRKQISMKSPTTSTQENISVRTAILNRDEITGLDTNCNGRDDPNSLETELDNANTTIVALRSENAKLLHDIAILQKLNEKIQADYNELQYNHAHLQNTHHQMQVEYRNAMEKLNLDLERSKEEQTVQSKELSTLKQKLATLQGSGKTLEENVLPNRIHSTIHSPLQTAALHEHQDHEIQGNAQQIVQLKKRIEQLTAEIVIHKENEKQLERSAQETNDHLHRQIDELKQFLLESQADREDLNAKWSNISSLLRQEKDKSAQLHQENARLQSQVANLTSEVKRFAGNPSKEPKSTHGQSKLKAHSSFYGGLQYDSQRLEKDIGHELISYQRGLQRSQSEVVSAHEEVRRLQEKIKIVQDDYSVQESRRHYLEGELDVSRSMFASVEMRLHEAEKDNARLSNDLQRWKLSHSESQQQISRLQKSLQTKESDLDILHQQYLTLQEHITLTEIEKSSLISEFQASKQAIDQLTATCHHQRQQLDQYHQLHQSKTTQKDQLFSERLEELSHRNEQLESIIQSHLMSAQQASLEIARLQVICEQNDVEKAGMQSKLDNAHANNTLMSDRLSRLEVQLAATIAYEEELKARHAALVQLIQEENNALKSKVEQKDKHLARIQASVHKLYDKTLAEQTSDSTKVDHFQRPAKSSHSQSATFDAEDLCSLLETISRIWISTHNNFASEKKSILKLFVGTLKDIVSLFEDESLHQFRAHGSLDGRYSLPTNIADMSVESISMFAIDQVRYLASMKQHYREARVMLQQSVEQNRLQMDALQQALDNIRAQPMPLVPVQGNGVSAPGNTIRPRGIALDFQQEPASLKDTAALPQRPVSPSENVNTQVVEADLVPDHRKIECLEKSRALQQEILNLSTEIQRIQPDMILNRHISGSFYLDDGLVQGLHGSFHEKATSSLGDKDFARAHDVASEININGLLVLVEELTQQRDTQLSYLNVIAQQLGLSDSSSGGPCDIGAITSAIQTMFTELQQCRLAVSSEKDELNRARENVRTIEGKLEASNKAILELGEELTKKGDMAAKVDDLQLEIIRLKKDNAELEDRAQKTDALVQSMRSFAESCFTTLGLSQKDTSGPTLEEGVSILRRKIQDLQDAEETILSLQSELHLLQCRNNDLVSQKNYLVREMNLSRDVENTAIALFSQVHGSSQSAIHSFSSHGGFAGQRTHRFGLRSFVYAIIGCQRLRRQRPVKLASMDRNDSSAAQSEIRQKDSQIFLLRSKIQSLEEKIAHDVFLQQRYQDLQEKHNRLLELLKQQEEQVQRIPLLEYQLDTRRLLIDNLRNQLTESSNPIRELKDELCLVKSQYQAAIIAKKEADAQVAKEKLARSLLESDISVLKHRIRGDSSVMSPMSHYKGSYSSQSSPFRLEDLASRFNSVPVAIPHDQRGTRLASLTSSPANPVRHGLVPNSDHEIERD
eukprot:TRINITY_DN7387_c0_g1_i1.p1 TRINITY_DN7387_c0_g1~~TRINITY_DN7387_c0_g1_i1.p1  ORF type:complete len:1703 (-),score=317.01 TRINITY_DN7387_c0_g1_i1:307-5415(-)